LDEAGAVAGHVAFPVPETDAVNAPVGSITSVTPAGRTGELAPDVTTVRGKLLGSVATARTPGGAILMNVAIVEV
jgi:hypothetical protein